MTVWKSMQSAAALGMISLAATNVTLAQNANQLQSNQQTQAGAAVPGNADANNQAKNQPAAGFNSISQQPWFANPTVRDQLQLNDTQFNTLNHGYNQSWMQYDKGWGDINSNVNLTPQQRAQQLQQLDSRFHRGFSNSVDSALTDSAARRRFNELGLQYRGYSAFSDPALQQQLALSPEQQQRFSQYNTDWNQRWNRWNTAYQQNPDQVTTQYNDWRNNYWNNVNQTLTPQQQQMWNTMAGKPYNFPADVYFQNNATTTTTAKPVIPQP